jgi:hypothetical protein
MTLLPGFVIFRVGKNAFGQAGCGSGRGEDAVRLGKI